MFKRTYNVDHYINKFEKIAENKWCTGELKNEQGQSCALGHCSDRIPFFGKEEGSERSQLHALVIQELGIVVAKLNDDTSYSLYGQETPKQRVLAALKDIKEKTA